MTNFNLKTELKKVNRVIREVRNLYSKVKLNEEFDQISDKASFSGERDRIK